MTATSEPSNLGPRFDEAELGPPARTVLMEQAKKIKKALDK